MSSMRRRTALAAAATAMLALPAATLGAAPAQAADTGTVSVLHGVPGLTVDVYANGKALLPNFKPGTLTPPTRLPAGTYKIAIFPDGKGPDGTPAISGTVKLPAGANATVAAHLNAGGEPQLSTFVNDTSKVAAGKGRLTVRHVAAAPAVDVRANGEPAFQGLTNPNEVKADLPAGSIEADVVLADTDTVAIGPADVNVTEGANTIVYAWGSAEQKNLALKVQTIEGLHSAPGGVPAGESGLASQQDGIPAWAFGLALAAALGLAASGYRLATVRSSGDR
jgi:hypothetical protein